MERIRMNAFEQYLLSIPRDQAISHMIDCLKANGELAWDLMARINGDSWKCRPSELASLVNYTLNVLNTELKQEIDTLKSIID